MLTRFLFFRCFFPASPPTSVKSNSVVQDCQAMPVGCRTEPQWLDIQGGRIAAAAQQQHSSGTGSTHTAMQRCVYCCVYSSLATNTTSFRTNAVSGRGCSRNKMGMYLVRVPGTKYCQVQGCIVFFDFFQVKENSSVHNGGNDCSSRTSG